MLCGAVRRHATRAASVRRPTDTPNNLDRRQTDPQGQYIRCPCGGRRDVRAAYFSVRAPAQMPHRRRTDAARTPHGHRTDAARTPHGRRTDIKLLSVRRLHGCLCGRFNCPCGRTDAARMPHGQYLICVRNFRI